jgi:hypothetical protein
LLFRAARILAAAARKCTPFSSYLEKGGRRARAKEKIPLVKKNNRRRAAVPVYATGGSEALSGSLSGVIVAKTNPCVRLRGEAMKLIRDGKPQMGYSGKSLGVLRAPAACPTGV